MRMLVYVSCFDVEPSVAFDDSMPTYDERDTAAFQNHVLVHVYVCVK